MMECVDGVCAYETPPFHKNVLRLLELFLGFDAQLEFMEIGDELGTLVACSYATPHGLASPIGYTFKSLNRS